MRLRLTADDIACERGGRTVFTGVSFTLSAGEALLVSGPNGAGKSSLLRGIAGLLRLAGGPLTLSPNGDTSIAEQAHYLGHHDAVKNVLTVAENLEFWTGYLGGRGDPRGALKAVGLLALANLPAGYLSAGQKRRLCVARLISAKRPLWLLDEPTSSLDNTAQAELAKLMKAHLRGGGLIVAASHGPIGLPRVRRLHMGGQVS